MQEANVMDNWKRIWGNRKVIRENIKCADFETVFMELKRLTGNDTLANGGVGYPAFVKQFEQVYQELTFADSFSANSFFEVGCGSGALLLLLQNKKGKEVGGLDYSNALIKVAKEVIEQPKELYCAEAIELDTKIKYDCLFSFSAFEYFRDYDYANEVLKRMLEKANYSMAVLDVHDINLQEKYVEYRRSVIPDYDEKYADLHKLFYDKSFFVEFAEKNNLDIKITGCKLEGYWNAPFTYDVYFIKNKNVKMQNGEVNK